MRRMAAECPKGQVDVSGRLISWGLVTLDKQYSVWGNTGELKQFERRRITVTGRVSPGRESFMDRLDVESVRPSEVPESQLQDWIGQLRYDRWTQPENFGNPTAWIFHFTPPMRQILQADAQIKDHIIILLGESETGKLSAPFIQAMADRNEARDNAYARNVNLVANLALTNITVADVIWHHGGGITRDACPDDPKSCWYGWWIERRATFDVSKTPSRNYSNYPSYGIYQDPGIFRPASWP